MNINLSTEKTSKIGSCSLIYSRLIIGANGLVNACACRDANYSLRLGNIKTEKIKDIISLKNKKYKDLIDRQEKNDFLKFVNLVIFIEVFTKKTFLLGF